MEVCTAAMGVRRVRPSRRRVFALEARGRKGKSEVNALTNLRFLGADFFSHPGNCRETGSRNDVYLPCIPNAQELRCKLNSGGKKAVFIPIGCI